MSHKKSDTQKNPRARLENMPCIFRFIGNFRHQNPAAKEDSHETLHQPIDFDIQYHSGGSKDVLSIGPATEYLEALRQVRRVRFGTAVRRENLFANSAAKYLDHLRRARRERFGTPGDFCKSKKLQRRLRRQRN